jgi:hypothetical protein
MEQRGALLRGIARVLNAGGSALVSVYDAAASIKVKTSVLPGEKGSLQVQLKEYEKKMERLYYEIGKEVALHEPAVATSAAGEAGMKLAAEFREKMSNIKRRIREIEEEEKAAIKAGIDSARAKAKPAADAEKPAAPGAPVTGESSAGAVTEDVKETVAEAAEAPEHELPKAPAEPEAPVAGEAAPGAETEEKVTTEGLEKMLKGDLLKLCKEKGIEANERMTKTAIIELLGRS